MRTSLSRTWAKRQNSSPFHMNPQTKSLHFLTFYTSSIFVEAQKSHFFSIKNSLKKGSPWNTMFHPLDKRDPSWESHTHKTKVRKNNLHQIIQGKHPATTNGFTQQYHQSSPFCVVLNRWTLYSKGRETCSRNWRCLDWNIDDRIISMIIMIHQIKKTMRENLNEMLLVKIREREW